MIRIRNTGPFRKREKVEAQATDEPELRVCWYRPLARWAVQRGDEICGTYLTREEAVCAAANSEPAGDQDDTGG